MRCAQGRGQRRVTDWTARGIDAKPPLTTMPLSAGHFGLSI
jgi:hypothetical protein